MSRIAALLVSFLALALPLGANAAEVRAAVAANFTEPAKVIAEAFKAQTGDTVLLSFGASGQLAAQIGQGAPFDVFLSADADRPAELVKAGHAVETSRFTYAIGKLVLYSTDPLLVDRYGVVLTTNRYRMLAIANPATAPYGRAATQVLEKIGGLGRMKDRIVIGASITQTYQFVATSVADMGFVALSEVQNVGGGSRWLVPQSLYDPINQQAVQLTAAKDKAAAARFLAFLKGEKARAIIARYGYSVPR